MPFLLASYKSTAEVMAALDPSNPSAIQVESLLHCPIDAPLLSYAPSM